MLCVGMWAVNPCQIPNAFVWQKRNMYFNIRSTKVTSTPNRNSEKVLYKIQNLKFEI